MRTSCFSNEGLDVSGVSQDVVGLREEWSNCILGGVPCLTQAATNGCLPVCSQPHTLPGVVVPEPPTGEHFPVANYWGFLLCTESCPLLPLFFWGHHTPRGKNKERHYSCIFTYVWMEWNLWMRSHKYMFEPKQDTITTRGMREACQGEKKQRKGHPLLRSCDKHCEVSKKKII